MQNSYTGPPGMFLATISYDMASAVRLNTSRRVSAERHRKGVNILRMDWSVDWTKSEDIDVDLFRHYMR